MGRYRFIIPGVVVVVGEGVVVVVGGGVANSVNVSHVRPVNLGGHKHMKPLDPIKHVPPFKHGLGWHWFTTKQTLNIETLLLSPTSFIYYLVRWFRIVGLYIPLDSHTPDSIHSVDTFHPTNNIQQDSSLSSTRHPHLPLHRPLSFSSHATLTVHVHITELSGPPISTVAECHGSCSHNTFQTCSMHATWTWAARAHHCKKTQHSPSNEWALTYRPSSSSCDHSNLEHIDRCSQQDSPYRCHRSDTQSPRSSHMGDSLDEIRGHAYKSKALLDWPTENGCFASSASEWIRTDTTVDILRRQLTQSTVLARCRCTRNYIIWSNECRMQKKCTWRNLTGWSTVAVETDAVHRATNLRAFSIVLAWSWSTEICTTSEEGWPSYLIMQEVTTCDGGFSAGRSCVASTGAITDKWCGCGDASATVATWVAWETEV